MLKISPIVALLFVSQVLGQEEKKQEVVPVQQVAKVPAEAVQMALADLTQNVPETMRKQRRYIWCPNRSDQEFIAASLVLNMVVSQSQVDVHPMLVADKNLIAVDLRVCAPDYESYRKLVTLWSSLSFNEPYFHVTVRNEDGKIKVPVSEYTAEDGKRYDYKWETKPVRQALAAPHLGEAGVAIETAMGNGHPERFSVAPVLRIDQWCSKMTSGVDGGKYLAFRNLEVGKTTLTEYLSQKGLDWQKVQKELLSDDRAAFISRVTGKPRAVSVFQGQGTRPSVGKALVAITDDPFDEEQRAEFDPFRQLLDSKTNGHEVFVTLPSGWLEFTLWNGDEKLVAEAPPNLVSDDTVPAPYTKRLHGAISCIRCHGPKNLWQPFTNEVAAMLGDRLRVFGDAKSKDNASTLARAAGLYSGDLAEVIRQAQLDASRRVFTVAKVEAAEAAKALSDIVNGYEYVLVDAAMACRELGIDVPDTDLTGVTTMRKYIAPQEASGLVLDDPIVGRFHVEYFDLELGRRKGLSNTRRQMEKVYADMMIRRVQNDTANPN